MITDVQLTRALDAARLGQMDRMYAELADAGQDWIGMHAAVLAELIDLRAEVAWRIDNETRAAKERDDLRAEVERLRGLLREACDLTAALKTELAKYKQLHDMEVEARKATRNAMTAEADQLMAEVERLRGLLREACDLTDEALLEAAGVAEGKTP